MCMEQNASSIFLNECRFYGTSFGLNFTTWFMFAFPISIIRARKKVFLTIVWKVVNFNMLILLS